MTKQQVMQSLDYQWHRRSANKFLAFWGIVAVVCLVVCMFVVFTDKDILFSFVSGVAVAAIFGVAFLPICIYHWAVMSRLTKFANGYVVAQSVLDNPHFTTVKNKCAYFTVTFTDKDGNSVSCDTAALFGNDIWAVYLLSDYTGKTVDIAYNAQLNKVIVLGVVD